ncbi:mannitol-1-phosphate 5-dehydrogenase [Candidatus Vecturithrix granuli]|uniref:Mannitol-1-phosphate 5-dehydrogenase n=1 Tax=Vecturithrix granuli TaxID=1499967 RepID=A0A081BZB5_VECG1|nr:mannitol-1-phosphate 5-dehydrogenase [Candidatus Vecturithrix granuli]
MKIAVQFGAGNIGRGFMGQLFWEAGYTTCFVEYNSALAAKLNERKQYPLRLLDAYSKQHIDLTITQIHALTTEEVREIAEIFSQADMIATAVGVKNLEQIAPLIAAGVKLRHQEQTSPVDIYLCENLYEAADMLKKAVRQCLDSETAAWAEEHIGFVGTSVARMVPAASGRFGVQDPLFVVADSYHKLAYDGPARRGQEPDIQGMYAVKNFQAEVERKLFTHNLGHAALAYLGYLKGYTYVHEPFDDPELCAIFNGALDETTEALLKRYPDDLDAREHADIRKDVNIRFGNPLIMDTVQRVARDPIRKLGPNDRLIGSAKLCQQYGIFPKRIASICGAALRYDYSEDPEAVKLQAMIREIGVAQTLQQVSGVEPTSAFGQEILNTYDELQKKSMLTPQ